MGLAPDLTVSVPAVSTRGAVAYLQCNYQIEEADNDRVNVTWYKDGIKFYHSVNEGLDEQSTVYDVPGVEVDVSI